MVGLVLDIIANTLFFVVEPLSMIKLLWQLCVRIVFFLTLPWLGMFKFIFNLYLDVCWRLILWGIATISIPIRLFTALRREKELEAHLYELQMQLEGLVGVNKDLERRLEVAIKNYRRTEHMLAEAEEEQDRALEKIQLLEIREMLIDANGMEHICYVFGHPVVECIRSKGYVFGKGGVICDEPQTLIMWTRKLSQQTMHPAKSDFPVANTYVR